MNVDMPKNLTYAFCTINGGTSIAVKKRRCGAESFSAGPETEYRSRIGIESSGDNNTRGDIKGDNKVDNKVDNNARGDNKVDNKVDNDARGDIKVDNKVDNKMDPYNHPVQHPYKIRTTPIQDPYNIRTIGSDKAGHWEVLER